MNAFSSTILPIWTKSSPAKISVFVWKNSFRLRSGDLMSRVRGAVQAYLDNLFRKSAVTEQVLYKADVADGYKLAGLVRRLE